MAKHTSGIWSAEVGEGVKVRAEHGGIIAIVCNLRGRFGSDGRVDPDEVSANARLIAAAPELKSALQALYEASNGTSDAEITARLNARALLAKIEGQ